MTQTSFSDIVQVISQASCIAIFWHDNPDGDAIGSMLGLGKLLENMEKKVFYFSYPVPSKSFHFLPNVDKIKSVFDYKKKYDLLIFVDFSPYDRCVFTAGHFDYFDDKPLIVIDHHYGDCPEHALVLKDVHADSNCERIFENTKTIRSQYYDRDVASYLYLWLSTDTGNFQYDKQWSRSLHNAALLVDLGANKQLISKKMFGTLKLQQLQFLSIIVPRFEHQDGIGYVWYSYDDFEQHWLDREEASWYVTTIISRIEWLRLAIILKVEEDSIKISLRSQDEKISACELAQMLWWGWHFYAAGAKIMRDPLVDVTDNRYHNKINTIISMIRNHIYS